MKRLGLLFLLGLWFVYAQTTDSMTVQYDVVVVGSEPEGIAAAVAAAESGASTLLITEDPQVGGLFVMGEMNSLDLRTQPFNYQGGLFADWWYRVGRGNSFDVQRAEQAFLSMLREAGVTLRTSAPPLRPYMDGATVLGVEVAAGLGMAEGIILASQIIDATSEMDFAAAAGANYTMGFESLGFPERMVDTLVFRIDGVDWRALQAGIRARGRSYANVDNWVAWGHFGGYPAAFQAQEPGIRLRGLNLGRQEDGSILVNALLIHGVDPFDPESVADGIARAEREAPRMIEYLRAELPGFTNASFGGVARKLYIRETRHLEALCMLTADDIMDNRVTPLDIAAGGYPLDVQPLTPHDSGFVFATPDIYGVQLCTAVPDNVDNLWVAGKSAGYDPIAASSARVVPFGMVVAEAIGVAAARAIAEDISPAVLVNDEARIAQIRQQLLRRGAVLPEVRARSPLGPYTHPYYDAFRLMLSRGLALGGYSNNPQLDDPMSAIGYVYLLSNIGQRFFNDREFGRTLVSQFPNTGAALTLDIALNITYEASCLLGQCLERDLATIQQTGFLPSSFNPRETLSRGEMYALAVVLIELANGNLQAEAP